MENYLNPLINTIIIELLVLFILGFKDKRLFLVLTLINIITNPALNYILLHSPCLTFNYGASYVLFLEGLVVIFEAVVLYFIFKNSQMQFFKLSFVLNVSSFLIGLVISKVLRLVV